MAAILPAENSGIVYGGVRVFVIFALYMIKLILFSC